MIVARLHGRGDVRVHEEPPPAVGGDQALVRVTGVGLCGSDLHWYEDASIGATPLAAPLVLGHEIVGIVASGPRAGQRVVVDPADACETCRLCLAGRPELCPSMRFAGHAPTDGGLRELMAWPERLLVPLPDAVTERGAAALETLAVALHAVELTDVRPGDRARVAVIGSGPIGLLVVAALRATGIDDVVATDRLPHRVERARDLGARAAWRSDDAPTDLEADVVIECAGTDDGVAAAVAAAAPGGRVVLVGIPASDATTFRASIARRKGLAFVHCRRSAPRHLAAAVDLAARRAVDLDLVVSDVIPLDAAPAAFAALAARRGHKIVVAAAVAA